MHGHTHKHIVVPSLTHNYVCIILSKCVRVLTSAGIEKLLSIKDFWPGGGMCQTHMHAHTQSDRVTQSAIKPDMTEALYEGQDEQV